MTPVKDLDRMVERFLEFPTPYKWSKVRARQMLEYVMGGEEETGDGYALVRADVLAWLHGEAAHPDTGQWFERPVSQGAYWWRSILRAATIRPAAPLPQRTSNGAGLR